MTGIQNRVMNSILRSISEKFAVDGKGSADHSMGDHAYPARGIAVGTEDTYKEACSARAHDECCVSRSVHANVAHNGRPEWSEGGLKDTDSFGGLGLLELDDPDHNFTH